MTPSLRVKPTFAGALHLGVGRDRESLPRGLHLRRRDRRLVVSFGEAGRAPDWPLPWPSRWQSQLDIRGPGHGPEAAPSSTRSRRSRRRSRRPGRAGHRPVGRPPGVPRDSRRSRQPCRNRWHTTPQRPHPRPDADCRAPPRTSVARQAAAPPAACSDRAWKLDGLRVIDHGSRKHDHIHAGVLHRAFVVVADDRLQLRFHGIRASAMPPPEAIVIVVAPSALSVSTVIVDGPIATVAPTKSSGRKRARSRPIEASTGPAGCPHPGRQWRRGHRASGSTMSLARTFSSRS